MKKLFLYILIIIAIEFSGSGNVYSANEYFRSISSGDWNLTSTWEMSLNNSTWGPATTTPDATSNLITVRYPNVVTVTANVSADQLSIDSGTISINAGIILTLLDGSGNDFTILKNGTVTGTGTFQTQGAGVTMNLRDGSNFNAALKVNTGTTLARDFSSPNTGKLFGSVLIDAGATLNTGNTSGTGTWFYGNIVNNGTLTATSTGGFIRIKGASLSNSGTVTTAGSIYFDTTTVLSGSGSFTANNTYILGNVTLGNNITYSPGSLISVENGAILNPNGNVFTLTSGALFVNGTGEISANGTVRTQNSVTIYNDLTAQFNANLNVNTGTTFTSDNNSPFTGKFYGNVTIDAGATLNGGNTSGKDSWFYGNIVNNGTLTATSTGGTLRIKGASLSNSGTVTTAGSIYFDTTTILSGSGIFTAANTYMYGNLTLGSNITYSPGSLITVENGAILNPNGNVFTLTSGTMYVNGTGEISANGTVRTQNSVNIYNDFTAQFNAILNVNTGTTLTSDDSSPYTGKFYGNVTIDAGATLNGGNISGRSTWFYGNIVNNGTVTATSIGGSIRIKCMSLTNNGVMNSNGSFFFDSTTTLSGTGSFTSPVIFAVNSNVTLNGTHKMYSISINSGGSFNISNNLLKLTASNPIAQNGTFITANSKIEYNGTALQTVSTANINYIGLKINNPAGAILPDNISIPDTLAIILGDLNLNGKIITITPAGYMTETPGNTVYGTTGYITTTRNVGTPSSLNVAGMGAVLTSNSNLGSTEIRRGHTVQTGLNGGTSIKRYFDITPTNNSGLNATLVYKFDDSELNGKPEPSLKLFKSTNSGSTWLYMGGSVNIAANEITLSGLTSFSRWSADSSGVSAAISTVMQGFYNNVSNQLSMSDTVRAYLRNSFAPYAVVDSSVGIIDSLTFKSPYQFPNAPDGNYYIQLKHRNSLETWSKFGVNYQTSVTLNYDFTFAASQSYGNNTVLKGSKYCMYSGDVTQDGFIDLADVVNIYNNATVFANGYVVTDVNGDLVTDLADVLIGYNNAISFVSAKTPLNP